MSFDQNNAFYGPKKESTVWRYFGNGTGRDSYVINECLIRTYKSTPPDKILFKSLRNIQEGLKTPVERDIKSRSIS